MNNGYTIRSISSITGDSPRKTGSRAFQKLGFESFWDEINLLGRVLLQNKYGTANNSLQTFCGIYTQSYWKIKYKHFFFFCFAFQAVQMLRHKNDKNGLKEIY